MTAVGVAIAAGRAVGVWNISATQSINTDPFLPTTTVEGCLFCIFGIFVVSKIVMMFLRFSDQERRYTKWKMAVARSFGWSNVSKSISMTSMLMVF